MNCPGCSTQVTKDAAICPHCDFIIDASFLPSQAAAAPAPARAAARGLPGGLPRGLGDHGHGSRPSCSPRRAPSCASARARTASRSGGLGLLLFSCFMPWQETALEGELLGLLGLGAPAFALGLVAAAALYLRARPVLPQLPAHGAWLAQLAAALLALFWCAVSLRLATDSTTLPSALGSFDLVRSAPAFGLFLALPGAWAPWPAPCSRCATRARRARGRAGTEFPRSQGLIFRASCPSCGRAFLPPTATAPRSLRSRFTGPGEHPLYR